MFPQCGLCGSVSSLEVSDLLISALPGITSRGTGLLYNCEAVMDSQKVQKCLLFSVQTPLILFLVSVSMIGDRNCHAELERDFPSEEKWCSLLQL